MKHKDEAYLCHDSYITVCFMTSTLTTYYF